ncbi:putative phosphatase YwpJ [compost metagenome]
MVYYNGALYECGTTGQKFHHAIGREQAERVIDFLLVQETEAEFSIEVQNRWFCARTPDYTRLTGFKELPAVIALQELKSYDCTKILIADFRETEALIAEFGSELNILVTDGGSLIQIMSPEASKERAITQLCSVLGIGMMDVMCFGDDYNDLGLFRACGYPVAMGNAVQALKDIAAETAETNDNEGVARVLEKLTISISIS